MVVIIYDEAVSILVLARTTTRFCGRHYYRYNRLNTCIGHQEDHVLFVRVDWYKVEVKRLEDEVSEHGVRSLLAWCPEGVALLVALT